ncbi:hypothetical protein MFIFM68171_10685 [Madurella fahalii]|uniref:Xaa-Pro aminopeptidase n=1 Tax=Madurella fahalii TaxID=1157608 RepID=A0ABQ0GRV2_9PEZI
MDYDVIEIDEFDALAIEPKGPGPAPAPPAAPSQLAADEEKLRVQQQQFTHGWLHEKLGKYPAKTHAKKVAKELGVQSGLIYLPGQVEKRYEDSDMGPEFRQRRHFFYMTGCDVPGCAVTYDLKHNRLILWIPVTDARSILWYGSTPTIEELKAVTDVDNVCYSTHLWRYLSVTIEQRSTVYVLHPEQAPKFQSYVGPIVYRIDSTRLRPAIENARVIKTDYEIAMIRRANAVSSAAHKLILMRLHKLSNERDIDAIFRGFCLAQGSKHQAYPVIAASGRAASTLHYIGNDQPLAGRQLVVLDAGTEWNCYASDITRTFPITGRFSPEAAAVYAVVDRMQRECIARVRPGVPFYALHLHACILAVGGLMKLGILRGGTPSEIFRQGTVAAFFPHGLGHHVGLEVHDVSGRARLLTAYGDVPCANGLPLGLGWGGGFGGRGVRAKREWVGPQTVTTWYKEAMVEATLSKVAVGTGAYACACVAGGENEASERQRLEKGMVVTIEPGIYFCRPYIESCFLRNPEHSKYINAEVLERYWDVGGVRIEDDILVTESGYENLTTAPKGEEMLKIINARVE